jgi:hypothetical protein
MSLYPSIKGYLFSLEQECLLFEIGKRHWYELEPTLNTLYSILSSDDAAFLRKAVASVQTTTDGAVLRAAANILGRKLSHLT